MGDVVVNVESGLTVKLSRRLMEIAF